jgi:hypothetical protein
MFIKIIQDYIRKRFPFVLYECESVTEKHKLQIRFEVSTAVTIKNAVFWDAVLCRSCVYQRFEGTYRLHLQGGKIRERGTSVSRWLQRSVPPNRRLTRDLHGATSQKTEFFINYKCLERKSSGNCLSLRGLMK